MADQPKQKSLWEATRAKVIGVTTGFAIGISAFSPNSAQAAPQRAPVATTTQVHQPSHQTRPHRQAPSQPGFFERFASNFTKPLALSTDEKKDQIKIREISRLAYDHGKRYPLPSGNKAVFIHGALFNCEANAPLSTVAKPLSLEDQPGSTADCFKTDYNGPSQYPYTRKTTDRIAAVLAPLVASPAMGAIGGSTALGHAVAGAIVPSGLGVARDAGTIQGHLQLKYDPAGFATKHFINFSTGVALNVIINKVSDAAVDKARDHAIKLQKEAADKAQRFYDQQRALAAAGKPSLSPAEAAAKAQKIFNDGSNSALQGYNTAKTTIGYTAQGAKLVGQHAVKAPVRRGFERDRARKIHEAVTGKSTMHQRGAAARAAKPVPVKPRTVQVHRVGGHGL